MPGCADNCMFNGKGELCDSGGLCTKGRVGEEGEECDNGADDWFAFDCGDDRAADVAKTVASEAVLSSDWLDEAVPTCEIENQRK